MSITIERAVEQLLGHPSVWAETKERLRELLAEHNEGKLDPDDQRYILALHQKMHPGKVSLAPANANPRPKAGASSPASPSSAPPRPASQAAGLDAEALIAALREDIANLVIPEDMANRPSDEQALRAAALETLQAALSDLAAKNES